MEGWCVRPTAVRSLFAAAVFALIWANSPLDHTYDTVWHHGRHAVNDGLMSVFFLVVGMEVKRELVAGELRVWRRAALPIVAALGGMAVPALVYAVGNAGGAGHRGWGVPMATDIAFAVGALSLLGARVPSGLKLFLLTLAVADDIASIVVLALFYSRRLDLAALAAAAAVIAAMVGLRAARVRARLPYLAGGVLLWVALSRSGVHAALAGVVLGVLLPVDEELESALDPWASYLVLPLFALANAGVHLGAVALDGPVLWGVLAGRVLGKPAGIVGATWVAVRVRAGELPDGVAWRHVAGVGAIAAVGFTVPLLFAQVALPARLRDTATVALLLGSVAGFVFAVPWFWRSPARHRR
jgi:NhaA family Na+:H+ antiporter